MYEGLEIQGRRQRLGRRDNGTEELVTTTETLTEEDKPKVLTTTTDALAKEVEETTRQSERLQQQRHRCVYGLSVLMITTASSTE